jgi:hypothetical protein
MDQIKKRFSGSQENKGVVGRLDLYVLVLLVAQIYFYFKHLSGVARLVGKLLGSHSVMSLLMTLLYCGLFFLMFAALGNLLMAFKGSNLEARNSYVAGAFSLTIVMLLVGLLVEIALVRIQSVGGL